ncbi:MAG: 50S ribosomal protein L32, partial [Candidatus Liptonbacteria bacterium]|nr:50S ribosomal protein L32 [Candidatus Liptonbacteria bacterium]
VPVKHHSKSKVGRRRAHLALKPKALRTCDSCRGPVLPHRTCRQCGAYVGRKKSKIPVTP